MSEAQEKVRIIALVGAKGCGKSEVAKTLRFHGYHYERFAGVIKDMLVTLGLTRKQVDGSTKDKETPCDLLCGKTPRLAMQTLGTEWRNFMGEELWSNIWTKRIQDKISEGQTTFVVDDMRFFHEVKAVRDLGGEIWVIRRPTIEPSAFEIGFSRVVRHLPAPIRWTLCKISGKTIIHESELYWREIAKDADVVIDNTGTLVEFKREVDAEINRQR